MSDKEFEPFGGKGYRMNEDGMIVESKPARRRNTATGSAAASGNAVIDIIVAIDCDADDEHEPEIDAVENYVLIETMQTVAESWMIQVTSDEHHKYMDVYAKDIDKLRICLAVASSETSLSSSTFDCLVRQFNCLKEAMNLLNAEPSNKRLKRGASGVESDDEPV